MQVEKVQVAETQRMKRGLIPLLLALAMAAALAVALYAALPAKAYAMGLSDNDNIDLDDFLGSGLNYDDYMPFWEYVASSNTIYIYNDVNNVNILGPATGFSGVLDKLFIEYDASNPISVYWGVGYEASFAFIDSEFIELRGTAGEFNIAACTISTTDVTATTLYINSDNIGVFVHSGGTVSAEKGIAVWQNNFGSIEGHLYVEGSGKVSTVDGTAAGVSSVSVSYDGVIEATGSGRAVVADKVSLLGGKVTATTNIAISADNVYAYYFLGETAEVSNTSATNPAMYLNGNGAVLNVEGGDLTVNGDILVINSPSWIEVSTGGNLTVNGDVTAPDRGFIVEGTGTSLNVYGNIIATAGNAIDASKGAEVTIGTALTPVNITAGGSGYGIRAEDTPTTVTVFGNIKSGDDGVNAEKDAEVTVTGNIEAGGTGVTAFSGANVELTGDIKSDKIGAYANGPDSGATVTVKGNVLAVEFGAMAGHGSTVSITGNITVTGAVVPGGSDGVNASDPGTKVTVVGDITVLGPNADDGVSAIFGAEVTVEGNIEAVNGIHAEGGAKVNVTGDIDASVDGVNAIEPDTKVTVKGIVKGAQGVYADNGSEVTIEGRIEASNGIQVPFAGAKVSVTGNIIADNYGILARFDAKVSVLGNIYAGWIGILAEGDGSDVFIKGHIFVSGPNAEAGVWSGIRGKVTVDGTITAPEYIAFHDTGTGNSSYVTANDYDASSSKPGFLQYTGGNPLSWVWVRGDASTLPGAGDNVGIWVLAIVTLLSLAGTTLMLIRRRVLH